EAFAQRTGGEQLATSRCSTGVVRYGSPGLRSSNCSLLLAMSQ
ncbi:hypothetical protein L195_g064355, partial [Trifolium pratense]